MTDIGAVDLGQPHRQSPWAMVFLGLRILRQLGLTQLVVLVLFVMRVPLDATLVLLPLVAILVLGALSALAWWRYTFRFTDGELIVTKGVLRVDRLTVPAERIQSIAIEQQLLHRMVGVVRVAVDSAGSSEAEFTIDAIDRRTALALERQAVTVRERIAAAGAPATDAPTSGTPEARANGPGASGSQLSDRAVFRHSPGRLLMAALTSWPLTGLIVLGPLVALGDDAIGRFDEVLPEIDQSTVRWWWIPIGLAVFLAFSVALNIVRVALRDWDLTLWANERSLRRTSGLLSKTSKASSRPRIQVVSSNQNPLQRLAGLHSVNLSTIGEGDLNIVGCDDDQWQTIKSLAQPDRDDQADPGSPTRKVSVASVWLATRNSAVMAAAAAALLYLPLGWWALLVFAVVAPIWWAERRRVQTFRWHLGGVLETEVSIVGRATRAALPRKVNTVTIRQSIFERRRELATVVASTAAGGVSIGMLPVAEAHALRDALLHQVETDIRPWM